ncbi:MAG: hypothetical protein ACI8P0_000696 [Planctomycetaceae bacterium]|jgi:hypothetical protein
MAVLETFSEVRRGFRQLSGDLNGGILDLEIVCPGSWDSRKPPDCFRPEDVIGKIRVPLNEGLSVFSSSAQPIQTDAHKIQPAQIKAFVDLCRNAGSLLPATRKNELRLYCDWDSRKPEELWIANLLQLTKKYSQARLNIDVIHILKPIDFSIDVITAWMDAGLIPDKSPTPIVDKAENKRRDRISIRELDPIANQHVKDLWRHDNKKHWGRFLATKIPGRTSPIDARTIGKLRAWESAKVRRTRASRISGRLKQHGMSKEFLEKVADPAASNFQNLIDEELDADQIAKINSDNELRRLIEDQCKDSVSDHVPNDDGTT